VANALLLCGGVVEDRGILVHWLRMDKMAKSRSVELVETVLPFWLGIHHDVGKATVSDRHHEALPTGR
jgi:hypothetical protein